MSKSIEALEEQIEVLETEVLPRLEETCAGVDILNERLIKVEEQIAELQEKQHNLFLRRSKKWYIKFFPKTRNRLL